MRAVATWGSSKRWGSAHGLRRLTDALDNLPLPLRACDEIVGTALDEQDERVRVDRRRVAELCLLDRPEMRAEVVSRPARTRPVDGVGQLGQLRDPLDGLVAPVRDRREDAAGPEHPGDLGVGGLAVEPVVRLGGGDGVEAAVGQRDRLGRAGERLRPRRPLPQLREHLRIGLDRDHPSWPRPRRARG